MNKRSLPVGMQWRTIVSFCAAAFGALTVLLIRLHSLAPNLSPTENMVVNQSKRLSDIVHSPIDLPQRVLVLLALHLPHFPTSLVARLPSVLFALLTLTLFTYLCQRWYGRRAMVFGFLVMLMSAWFLHIARFAGHDIELAAATMSLVFLHVFYHDHAEDWWATYVWIVGNAVLLYIPGMVWLVLVCMVWQHKDFMQALQNIETGWERALILLTAFVLLFAYPAYTLVRSPQLLLPWLGLPNRMPVWRHLPGQLLQTVGMLVYHGPHQPELWLGQLALLNTFGIALFLGGIFFYARHWQAPRTWLLASCLAIGIILATLQSTVSISIVLPVVYLIVIGGVAYILHYWLTTFPRNQLARMLGISVVTVTILVSCFYNAMQYFVAWPHNPETIAVYQQK